MDKLKGKRIMVWTFMGNARMYEALRDYGDRIDTIGLFSFKVDKTGTITESGVAISNMPSSKRQSSEKSLLTTMPSRTAIPALFLFPRHL